MGGLLSRKKDRLGTLHETTSLAEETERVQTRKDSEKKPKQLASFSEASAESELFEEIQTIEPFHLHEVDPDSSEEIHESINYAIASSSSRSLYLSSRTKVAAKASSYGNDPLHFESSPKRSHGSYIHHLREEDLEFMDEQDYHASAHCSLDRIPIKLSAKQLIEHDILSEPDYLIDIISKECSKSSTPKRYFASDPIFYLDLLVDLSELECKKPSSKYIHRSPSSQDYYRYYMSMHHDDIYLLENDCQVSLVVTQTAQKSISKWAIMQVQQIFNMLNLLYGNNLKSGRKEKVLQSVDISGCTVPTQVLLLTEILPSSHQDIDYFDRFLNKCFSLKIVCFFSKDLKHLREDELAWHIEMLQPLVINGDIRKEHLQRLIQCICITYQTGQMLLAFAANNENLTHALIEVGEDVNKTDKDGKTALFYAGKNEKVTHALISAGADVNKTDKDGKTALFYSDNNEKVTHALIKAGVDVNITDKHGKTALFYAGKNEKVTDALIKAGVDVNKTDKDGKTALFYAVDNEKVTDALIKAGVDVNITDKHGKTALFYINIAKVIHALIQAGVYDKSIIKDDPPMLIKYDEKIICTLMAASTDVNLPDMDGKTPLTHAILNMNDEQLSCALIDAGADVNIRDKYGKTALFYAVHNQNMLDAVISGGADVNITDTYGKTALFYAINNENVFHALIEADVDVNITDKDGKTVLFFAKYNENIIGMLTAAGADVNIADKNGKTALFYVFDKQKVFHALIKTGADVNITDKDGKTALFYAGNNEEVTHALIEAGADVNKTDVFGETALFYAVNEEVVHALISAGVDVNITDKDGKTSLFYAGNKTVAQSLVDAGAQIDATDRDGKTALFSAVVKNEVLTHALIEAGADVNITDKDGKTALFYSLNNEKVTHALIEAGADINITGMNSKTAFLHVFDTDILNIRGCNPSKQICKCLLENGSSLCETSKEEETAFHLIFKHFQQVIISAIDKDEKQLTLLELINILELFSELRQSKVAVNKRDIHLNSPLHRWASLAMASSYDYGENVFDGYSFEHLLKRILDLLLKCGVQLDDKNERGETPLHVCRTWTAVKLLLDAGANPSVTDSSGRTPLLAAAMNNTCLKNYSDRFYPNVTQDPRMFWNDALEKKLDPWTADKNGETVLSVILKKNCYQLASSLVEVACKWNYMYTQSDEAGVSLLAAICKDKSTERRLNKLFLVKKLLSSRRSLAQGRLSNQDTPLHFSCRNMLELPEESVKTSLHWKIAQYLLLCGAGVETPGVDGKSCLELAEKCPILKDLLSMPVSSEEVSPLITMWKPTSLKHNKQLAKVARGSNCQQMESIYYFNEALDNGSFGLVFVGIDTQYSKEVAVKCIELMRIDQEKVRKEIKDLKATIGCDKVIQCLLCTEDKDFLYVVLELMEGNLADLLSDEHAFDCHQKIKLCRDITTGLEYLHRINITHRGIKPSNILYQVLPTAINLKLAFFGLRCQMSEQSTSDFTDTYESLTKARCWMAPEVLQFQSHSQSSDVFSCGLVIHYVLSGKKHPFAPVGSSEETSLAVSIETVGNITHYRIELDETISSDAKDLLKGMLEQDTSCRPKISQVLAHQFFQATSEQKVMNLL